MSEPKPKKRRRRRTTPVLRELVGELAQVVINIRCVVADLRHIVAELQVVRPRKKKPKADETNDQTLSLFRDASHVVAPSEEQPS